MCDKHNPSEIGISISTRKRNMFLFSCAYAYAYFTNVIGLSHKCEPGLRSGKTNFSGPATMSSDNVGNGINVPLSEQRTCFLSAKHLIFSSLIVIRYVD